MTNHLAIATVTTALANILTNKLSNALPDLTVTMARPDAPVENPPKARINVYLYHATANPAWRNADLRTRRPKGDLIKHGQAGLDLEYLLTFYGNPTTLEPQRLLGMTLRAMVDRPILSIEQIEETISKDKYSFLRDSELANQVQSVKFIPSTMNAEQLSRIWSSFFQTPYSLSFAYQATAVLIQGEKSGQSALPVRSRQFGMASFRPTVEKVEEQKGPNRPIFADSKILVRGRDFRGDSLQVHLGETIFQPKGFEETEIALQLSPELPGLRVGVQTLQIHADRELVSEREDKKTQETLPPKISHSASNPFPIVVCPRIVGEPRLASREERSDRGWETEVTATVAVDVVVSPRQRVFLLLNQIDKVENPVDLIFQAEGRDNDTRELYFQLRNILPGTYLLRVQIDGAESPLIVDQQGRYARPRLAIEPVA